MAPDTILTYPEAAALVTAHATALSGTRTRETLPIGQTLGRVLATGIRADRDQPPFHRSTRDGYAMRAAEAAAGTPLRVVGEIQAGRPADHLQVNAGEAIEIMTGAPVPAGADAVLMVEHTETASMQGRSPASSFIPLPGRTLVPGENIVPAGAEARAGDLIIPAGTRLTAMHIAAAVSCGHAQLDVFTPPRVAILSTGDELVEPGIPLEPHQIRNSNSYSIAGQVQNAGATPLQMPIVRDTLDALHQALDQASGADLILLSGGVSMGRHDLVERALAHRNAEFFFTGVRIQPGKPLVFGRLPGVSSRPHAAMPLHFFGLPGNPVSTMVTFALFAGPFLRALGGETNPQPLFARATLTTRFTHQPGLTRFLPALLSSTWNAAEVSLISWQGSGDLAATARANCFVVIPPDRAEFEAGADVGVLLACSQ